jgi:hypothetical protein
MRWAGDERGLCYADAYEKRAQAGRSQYPCAGEAKLRA